MSVGTDCRTAGYQTNTYIVVQGTALAPVSAAARLAALELLWGPFRWKKTEHGLDDASRRERATKSLLELERLVSGLIKRGELAQIQD